MGRKVLFLLFLFFSSLWLESRGWTHFLVQRSRLSYLTQRCSDGDREEREVWLENAYSDWLENVELLGKGSYGFVHKGSTKQGKKPIVVKASNPGHKKAEAFLSREAAINKKVAKDPNLANFTAPYLGEHRTSSGVRCLVWKQSKGATATLLDYIEGSSGKTALGVESLANDLNVSPSRVLWKVLDQLSLALYLLHQNGVIHRDIKPENIIVDKNSATLRIIDFGSACDLKALGPGRYQQGTLPCSPLYMAPEGAITFATPEEPFKFDCFSLGMLMVRLAFSSHINSESALSKFTKELKSCGHDIDEWVKRKLDETLITDRLVEGLAVFGDDAGPKEQKPFMGASGWRLLRGLLFGEPRRRLSLSSVRSCATMHESLSDQSVKVDSNDIKSESSCDIPLDANLLPILIHVTLQKPFGMLLEERFPSAASGEGANGGLRVAEILEGSAAEKSGVIDVGDWLIQVNTVDVSDGHFDDVMNLLLYGSDSKEKVDLIFSRLGGEKTDQKQSAPALNVDKLIAMDFGTFKHIGSRSKMEDRVILEKVDNKGSILAGVFDGHGGSGAANFCENYFAKRFMVALNAEKSADCGAALNETWNTMCQEWLESESESGTTATLVLVQESKPSIAVLNCGDTRAVMVSINGPTKVLESTTDHIIDIDATERIAAAGGNVNCIKKKLRIEKDDLYLSVASAMTTRKWRESGVSTCADIYEWEVLCDSSMSYLESESNSPLCALIVASDGVFNHISSVDAAHLLSEWYCDERVTAKTAAENLCKEARRRGGYDNVAAVVLYLGGRTNGAEGMDS